MPYVDQFKCKEKYYVKPDYSSNQCIHMQMNVSIFSYWETNSTNMLIQTRHAVKNNSVYKQIPECTLPTVDDTGQLSKTK